MIRINHFLLLLIPPQIKHKKMIFSRHRCFHNADLFIPTPNLIFPSSLRSPTRVLSIKQTLHASQYCIQIQFIIGIDTAFTPSIIPLPCPIYCAFWAQKLAAYPTQQPFTCHSRLRRHTQFQPDAQTTIVLPSTRLKEEITGWLMVRVSRIRTEHHQLDWLRSGK